MTEVPWGTLIGAVVFVGVGTAAYAGVARDWVRTLWPTPRLAFAMLWLGLGGLLVAVGTPRLQEPVWALLLGLPAALLWVIGIVSLFRMPRFLQPRWYRDPSPDPSKETR